MWTFIIKSAKVGRKRGNPDAEEQFPRVLKHDVFMDWKQKRPWLGAKCVSDSVTGLICTSCDAIKDL